MVSVFRIICDYFLVFCIITGSFFTVGSLDKDLNRIEDNIVKGLLSGEFSPFSSSDINSADKLISLISYDKSGNCYFSDVDYTSTDRSNWLTKKHLNRTERLAILYRNENDVIKKEEYKNYILKLINHWLKNDYQNSNWWHNKLGTPNTLGEIALLMRPDLKLNQRVRMKEIIGRGSFTVNTPIKSHAAANIIDLAMSTIKFGVFSDSRTSVRTAVRLVSKELNISENEGLKSDATFFQHGNRLYMGGYGIEFISGMSQLIYMLSGTRFNFSPAQLNNLSTFITDGLAVMSFGNVLDPTVMGRSVSRYNSQPLKGIAPTLRKLSKIEGLPGSDKISAYAERIEKNTHTDTGIHYFDKAKFIVINNSDFYFSFRGGAEELLYSEIINDENVLSYNSSFPGVTTIMHTGNEYTNISPVLDYSMIPGTTAAYETDEELRKHEDYTYRALKGIYGSCCSDGKAISFAQTEHEGIKMTISCFATDNAAFLLGSGFKDSQCRNLITTIDQAYYTGNLINNGNEVIHNGIKYTLLEGGNLTAKHENRTGTWRRNNLSYGTEPVSEDIFSVSFINKGSYAYSVMSEKTDETIKVIKNTDAVQAIKMPDGKIAAVFYKDCSFNYNGVTYKGSAGKSYVV